MLASVAEQASLSLTWSEPPKNTFSYDKVHILVVLKLPKILQNMACFENLM